MMLLDPIPSPNTFSAGLELVKHLYKIPFKLWRRNQQNIEKNESFS